MATGDLQVARELAAKIPVNGHGSESLLSQVEGYHLTDAGNAKRLVAQHGADLRYCWPSKKWYVWDTTKFAPDNTGELPKLAKARVAMIYADAAACIDEEERKRLGKWAASSENRQRIDAMIDLARSEPGIPVMPEEMDSDPWLLNCPNGTVDLRTGQLRAHRHEDLITKSTSAEYHPDARFQLFDDFLDRVLPDPEVRSFVKRGAGSSLVGLNLDERLYFAYGRTATGKTTLLRSIRVTLGDYGGVADFSTFLQMDHQGPRNDIARLAGKRFVISIEVEQGQKLAESLVQTITGGDPMTARHLYQEFFEFVPSFTLWLAANNRPKVRDDNDAAWRRIVQVPFDVQIPEGERDEGVKLALSDPDVAGPAILAWLVEGCLEWQRTGLAVPDPVRATTEDYRREMDPLAQFLEDRCVQISEAKVGNGELFDAYKEWVKTEGVRFHLGRKSFTQRLESHDGVSQQRGHGGVRHWAGLGLLGDEVTLG